MKNIIITILNTVAFIPLIIFLISSPVAFIMSFASPTSSSLHAWIIRIAVFVIAPLLVIFLVYLSRKHQSLIFALLALYPLIYFGYKNYIAPTPSSIQFSESKKDFVCKDRDDAFLSITGKGFGTPLDGMQWVNFSQKTGLAEFVNDQHLGVLYKDFFIPIAKLDYINDVMKRRAKTGEGLVGSCKNADGKIVAELYPEAPESIIAELNMAIEEGKK